MASVLSRSTEVLTAEAFEARFSDLIELICDAAQAGRGEPFLEAQYAVLRAWLNEHFPQVAPKVSAESRSDFESLFRPATLGAILESDQGELMGYLLRTQHAIMAWKNTPSSLEKTV